MNRPLIVKGLMAGLVATSISACNIEELTSNNSSDKSLYVATGVVTKLDQLTVNGIAFDTTSAQISVDDTNGSQDDLSEGMVVTVEGSLNSDGSSGVATRVVFDNELEGMVIANNVALDNTLDVMGQIVLLDQNTHFYSKLATINSPADIVAGQFVEVSGVVMADGRIQATRIEVKADTYLTNHETEVKGLVSNLTASTFQLGALTVDYTNATLRDFGIDGLKEGQMVEVKSMNPGVGTVLAETIELESYQHDSSDSHNAEVEGMLVQASDGSLSVSGVNIVIDGNTYLEHGSTVDLLVGQQVEVKGNFDDQGRLLANEIETESNSDSDYSENELEEDSEEDKDDLESDDHDEKDDD